MPDDRGGSVLVFAAQIALARGPRLLPKDARSATCMWLGYRHAYVDPQSRFGFHALRRDYTGLAGLIYEHHLHRAHPELHSWFKAVAADSDDMIFLSGKQLIQRGWAVSVEEYYA
jgi:hypothetical protein